MAHILVADTEKGDSFLRNLLTPHHDIVVVRSMSEAAVQLKQTAFDLIIIDLHFDESRMFDAIHLTKAIPKNSDKPIICFGTQSSPISAVVHESVAFTVRAMGAWMFLDLQQYAEKGDPKDELLRIFERCLVGEARKATQAERVELHKQRAEIHQLRLGIENQEWSPQLENELIEMRQKLTNLLLEHCDLQMETLAEQEQIDNSRDLKDRVSDKVIQGEDRSTRTERNQTVGELHHAVDEFDIAKREAQAKQKRR